MKRYIKCTDHNDFIDQIEHLVVKTKTPFEEIFKLFDDEFKKADPTTQQLKVELDKLFDRNASDEELGEFIDSASYDIEDNGDYRLLHYYFDRKYRHKYSPF